MSLWGYLRVPTQCEGARAENDTQNEAMIWLPKDVTPGRDVNKMMHAV